MTLLEGLKGKAERRRRRAAAATGGKAGAGRRAAVAGMCCRVLCEKKKRVWRPGSQWWRAVAGELGKPVGDIARLK